MQLESEATTNARLATSSSYQGLDSMTLSEALERVAMPNFDRITCSSTIELPSTEWDLNTGFTQARQLASEGWPEIGDELWKGVTSFAPKLDEGDSFGFDVAGDEVDVGRYLAGEPECMTVSAPRERSSIRILMNCSYRASADANHILNRGVAIATVIYALQSAGYGVSLDIVEVSENNGNKFETRIQLQDYGEYLNPGRLAFWTSHPAALRRIIFRLQEQQNSTIRRIFGFSSGNGYGYPTDLSRARIPKNCVYIPFPETSLLRKDYRTRSDALRSVIREFKDHGVPIEIFQSQTGEDQNL